MILDRDIVSSSWKREAAKAVTDLRTVAKIKDEETHLILFINMWNTMKQERPELFTKELIADCRKIIRLAASHEIAWGKWIISEGVMGLTDVIIEDFIRFLADTRLQAIGLEKMYEAKNPVTWFFDASNVNNGDTNFFESKPIAYMNGSLEW